MFKLFFESDLIGQIENINENFPNLSGSIRIEHSIPDIIKKYITYSVEDMRHLTKDVNSFKETVVERDINILLSSDQWYLINEKGNKLLILTPIFYPSNIVVWRWRVL